MATADPREATQEFLNYYKQINDNGSLEAAYDEIDRLWGMAHDSLCTAGVKGTLKHCLYNDDDGTLWMGWDRSEPGGFFFILDNPDGSRVYHRTLSEVPAEERVRYYRQLPAFFRAITVKFQTILSVLNTPNDPRTEVNQRRLGSNT